MTYTPVDLLEVRAFDHLVGAIAPEPNSHAYVFEYSPDWQQRGLELSPLLMPVSQRLHVFAGLNRDTYLGLPPLLADSLPDKFGNALVDAWMTRNGVDPASISALDRLAYTADRGMGALSFHPPVERDGDDITAVALADLVTAARGALHGQIDPDDHTVTAEALTSLIRVGTSAGGARPKAVIAFNSDTGQIRSGQLDAPDGFTHWLCKLDGVRDDDLLEHGAGFGRVEYAYHLMAVEAGVDMTECRLLEEFDRAHFLTRRFDRTDTGERRHILTLCGLAHLDFNLPRVHDYAQYLDVIDRLGLGPDARHQAFTRMVFNVAAANFDDHTKNVSFVMDSTGRWALAPAYDVTFAHNPEGAWTSAHQMSVNGRFEDITAADLRQVADRFVVPSPVDAIDRVITAVGHWSDFASRAGVADATMAHIATVHEQLQPT